VLGSCAAQECTVPVIQLVVAAQQLLIYRATLIQRTTEYQPIQACAYCMCALCIPMQEADSRKISCRPERRLEFADELQASIPDALNLLTR